MGKQKLEYKIDDLLSVKLVNGKTHIYINNKNFKICKHVVLNIPLSDVSDDFETIDDVILKYRVAGGKTEITPEEELFVHYSNLKAWQENNYNLNVLDSSLSFPLLMELSKYDIKYFFILLSQLDERYQKGSDDVKQYLLRRHDDKGRKLINRFRLTKEKIDLSPFLIEVLKFGDAYLEKRFRRESLFYYTHKIYPIDWERELAEEIRERKISIVSDISDYFPLIWAIKHEWRYFSKNKRSPQYRSISRLGIRQRGAYMYYVLERIYKQSYTYLKAIVRFLDGTYEIHTFREKQLEGS